MSFGSAAAVEPSRAEGPGSAICPGAGRASTVWTELLSRAIECEILPRIISAQRAGTDSEIPGGTTSFSPAEIADFVELIIADDMEQVRAQADRVVVQGGGREALLNQLLTPAARMLGIMWEQDVCDFITVTLGVYRLDQIMKETASLTRFESVSNSFDRRILLLPAPGEQHNFGIGMVADAFREAGWCVRSGPAATRAKLLHLVRDEWFDVIGLSVTSERWLKGLPACIRAVRHASCNPDACIMLGGYAINNHAERARFLGADITAIDADDAVQKGNNFVGSTVTQRLQPFRNRLVDAG
jgi:methanogenic corrinoid protein MtbC1